MQNELKLIGEVSKPELLDEHVIIRCRNVGDAIQETWNFRRRHWTYRSIAAEMGLDHANVNRAVNGDIARFILQLPEFQHLCGNKGILQYLAHASGDKLLSEVVQT